MNRSKVLALILLALVIAFSMMLPGIDGYFQHDQYVKWLKGSPPVWQGSLKIWHINTWQTGYGAFSTHLKNVFSGFEKSHYGVFVDVEGLTPEEASAKLQRGELPDILSFGMGYIKEPEGFLQDIDEYDGLREPLARSATFKGKTYARPYALGGYLLLINEEICSSLDIDMAYDWPDTEWFNETMNRLETVPDDEEAEKLDPDIAPIAFVADEYRIAQASLAASLGSAVQIKDANTELGHEDFVKGKAALYVCGAQDIAMMEKDSEKNPLPAYSALPLAGYTDMVQYVGITAGIEEDKRFVCKEALDYLLEQKNQMMLGDIGAIPVLQMDEPSMQEEHLSALEEAYCYRIGVPNAFSLKADIGEARKYLSGNDGWRTLCEKIETFVVTEK